MPLHAERPSGCTQTPVAEANFHNDPEAAKLVFASLARITVAPLDVTTQLDLQELLRRCATTPPPAVRVYVALP
jgi:purine nucleosidase